MARIENGRQPDAVSIHTVGSQFDEESSFGSDSEINGFASDRQTDKYGFIGGAQKYSTENAQDVPPEVLRQREVKWLDMLNHWDRWLFKRHKKVRLRCQKGIPPSLRGRAWLYLSGGKVKKEQNKGTFKELDSMQGDPKWMDVIERDLHRQFPFHEMFVSRGGHGQQDLLRVLKAYTLYRPDEGYCQAQAPIAAVLLMHMPAEEAFWCLVQICERYLPGYYSAGLEAIQLDGEILYALLRRVCSVAYRHLEKHKIEPILYMTEWFMCAFSRTLPWASVLRVWDMFLCDGVKIIFRVGLVLLRSMLGTKEKLKASQGQYETMELLRAIEPRYMQEAYLVHQVLECGVSVRDVEREHHVQLKRWRKRHGELSYKSAPRMHGALAVMAAEPHSRQDLFQNPTIIVQNPLHPATSDPTLARTKKRGTLRKSPKPVPDIPNPYALPSDPRLTPAAATSDPRLTPAAAPSDPRLTPAATTSDPRLTPAAATSDPRLTPAAATSDPSDPRLTPAATTSDPSDPRLTPPEGAVECPAAQTPLLLPPPSAPARSPSPHPPMFYQPPPQQPISSQPSPALQPMSSQHLPPQQQQQQQANGQPITTQPQRQHPPMFYQPPPITESPATPPQPITESPATPPQPTTESPATPPQPTTESPATPPQPTTESPATPPQPTTESPATPPQPITESPATPPQPITESPATPPQPTTESPATPPQPTTESPATPPQPITESPAVDPPPPPAPSQTPPPPPDLQPITESLPQQEPIGEPDTAVLSSDVTPDPDTPISGHAPSLPPPDSLPADPSEAPALEECRTQEPPPDQQATPTSLHASTESVQSEDTYL
ncbi:TBC1 domain family member 10A-like isoform X2 [Sardina pilchardus]|uniref:TBC1 domain family member 10A-like isoform X2 n=1 Tax=Sardina pilchardus TaxID=27697 RepID=UPI002E0F10B1